MGIVFRPDAARLEAIGFGAIADVPVLFDGQQRYLREHNRYLRELALGDTREVGFVARRSFPAKSSMEKTARALSTFVEWCAHRVVDWRAAEYPAVLAFQNDQHLGRWSPSGRALDAGTANFRADVVTDFLEWAAGRHLRDPFEARFASRSMLVASGHSSRPSYREVKTRWGRAKGRRSNGGELVFLPSADSVRSWLGLLRTQRGYAKYLACRFIIETGSRRAETAAIREDQVPTAESLDVLERNGVSRATMTLTNRTKGGRPRDIEVAVPFLRMLRAWIEGPRLRLRMLWHRRMGTRPSCLLFLSDARGFEGTPIADHTIYDCFHELKPAPPKWHPHFGRHVYACFFVLHALEQEAAIAKHTLAAMGADWIQSRGLYWLRTLQRQLGHLSDITTETYLRWLVTACGVATLANAWHEFLSTGETELGQ